MVNGSVGSGKTSTAVYLAIRSYKKNLRAYKFRKFLHLKVEDEEPLLYSNIPLFNVKYVPFTTDMILRRVRFNKKSIILLSESSLIANSQSNKSSVVNERLTLFVKLIRHELHGTYSRCPNMIVETQSINDNHYAFDRCITQSLYIVKKYNLPFFRVLKVRELLMFDSVVNQFNNDIEKDNILTLIVPKSVFKKYDSYAYSVLTDNLPTNANIISEKWKIKKKFHIATLLHFNEIKKYNESLIDDLKEGEK